MADRKPRMPHPAAMREYTEPQADAAKLPMIWPHLLVLLGESFLVVCAFDYLNSKRRSEWAAGGTALSFILGALTVYQFVQTVRRKEIALRINQARCRLYLAIGVAGAAASHSFDDFTLTMTMWGLICLWSYNSLESVKRPFQSK